MSLVAALLLPLLAAAALALPRGRAVVAAVTPWLPLAALAAALFPPAPLHADGLLLGLRLGLDLPARGMLAACALIWVAAGRALQQAGETRARRLLAWHLSLAGNVGVLAAQDGPGLYLFFALLSIAAYGVVVRDGSGRDAGRLYLAVALAAELLLLAGLMLLAADRPGPAAALLLLFGLGAKLGLLPLHFPLPPAYLAAGPAGAAVFGGALTIAAAGALLRLLPGLGPQPELAGYTLAAGMAAALLGALAGVFQHHPRALLAYSTISQMGLFTAALGPILAAPGPAAVALLAVLVAHHGLVKAALLLGSDGGGRGGWVLMLLLSLSLAALPGSGGALVKAGLGAAGPGMAPSPLPGLLPLTSIATTLLMARLLWLLRRPPARPGPGPAPGPFRLLSLAALAAPWPLLWWLHPAPAALAAKALDPAGALPLLAGLVLVLPALLWRRRLPELPPGDLAALLLRLPAWSLAPRPRPARVWRWPQGQGLERRLRRLPVTGALLFGLLLALLAGLYA